LTHPSVALTLKKKNGWGKSRCFEWKKPIMFVELKSDFRGGYSGEIRAATREGDFLGKQGGQKTVRHAATHPQN
jgi:hypothetical protein